MNIWKISAQILCYTEMNRKDRACKVLDCIHVTRDMEQCLGITNTVVRLRVKRQVLIF